MAVLHSVKFFQTLSWYLISRKKPVDKSISLIYKKNKITSVVLVNLP
jgi:hypothetical protein